MPDWRPLSEREAPTDRGAVFDILHPGVPSWLKEPLLDWVIGGLSVNAIGGIGWSRSLLQRVQMELRLDGEDWADGPKAVGSLLLSRAKANNDFLLDVTDCLLKFERGQIGKSIPERVRGLQALLDAAGSVYTISPRPSGSIVSAGFQLEHRVPANVVSSAKHTISASGRAGVLLAQAWSAAYGRVPNPSGAYRDTVRAVETVACPLVLRDNSRATLGTVIAHLRDAPGKWELVLTGGPSPVEAARKMMELLWTSQIDRHGTQDESAPLNVTVEEARAAVHLGDTLVEWIRSGVLRPVP